MFLPLRSQLSLGLITVSLALSILFVRILHSDLLTEQILSIHHFSRRVRGFKGVIRYEAIPLRDIILVANDRRWRHQRSELGERIEQDLFVNLLVQVVHEQLGANVCGFLFVGARFVDADGLLVQANPVEDLGSVVGALRGVELYEAVALVCTRHTIHGHVDIIHGAHLGHQLPEIGLADALIEVADVDGRVLVLLPVCNMLELFTLLFLKVPTVETHQCLAMVMPWESETHVDFLDDCL